jgi:exodeoxyribonuclease VII small subunit
MTEPTASEHRRAARPKERGERGGEPVTADLSYEQARAELAAVVEKLEAGGTSLEESLALWERGEQLAAVCQRWLDGARERLSPAEPSPGS